MKNLLFAGVAGLALSAIAPAMAASDSFAPSAKGSAVQLGGVYNGGHHPGPMPGTGPMPHPMPGTGPMPHPMPPMGGQHRWGGTMGGRWFAGFYAPGGWGGYRVPTRGFTLPTYWIQPSYRIANYPLYGLYAPQTGYGWSRYYDDAVLTDSRGYVQDYRSNIPWDRYEGGYAPGDYPQPEYGPAMGADRGVYYGDDRVYSNSYPAPQEQQRIEYRPGTGDDDYGAPYAGGYRDDNYGYPAPAPAYRSRAGFERYERCMQERGITGGVLGAVVGAVIGNRVAGRGDRLAGSLIGGGVGAIAGVGIEKAVNKCRKYLPREDYYYYGSGYPQGGHPGGYAPPAYQPQPYPYPQPYPQQGGGYYQQGWYYPAPVVTTITVSPSVSTTTTTTTEEVYYETVSVPVKKRAIKKWRPKPKPRCACTIQGS